MSKTANKKITSPWNKEADQLLRQRLKDIRDHDSTIQESPPPPIRLAVGERAKDQSVFLGQYRPVNREGHPLGKIFNVFAAPEDLTDEAGNKEIYTYVDTVKRISQLKDWHGHDGTAYQNDEELYAALEGGVYDGGWIIPTSDLLMGKDVDDNEVQPDNLYAHRERGGLKDTFTMYGTGGGIYYPEWYWSSTEDRQRPSYVQSLRFEDGKEGADDKEAYRFSCRPVRLSPLDQKL